MKTLKTPRLLKLFAAVFLTFASVQMHSQCSVNAGPDATKCLGQPYNPGPSVTTSGTTGTVTYSWNGTTFNPTPNTSLAPTTTTTYTLTIQDASGCIATDQITVNILALPTVNAGADTWICPGTPTNLCATASSPNGSISLYTWASGPANQCWNVSPTAQTLYTVTVIDAAGCQKSDAITVLMYPVTTVSAGADQSMCLSEGTLQLTGTPTGGTWTGTGVNSSGLFTATTTGTNTLTYSYTNTNGCINTDQTIITVTSPSPISGGADMELCVNAPAVQLPSVGTWSGSALVSSSGLFTPSAAGTYNLTVTSGSASCSVSDNVQIIVHPNPIVNAGSDQNICTGQSASLNATASSANGSITTIAWTGSGLSSNSILNPVATPGSTTLYTLTVTDNEGCSASDNISINVNAYPVVAAGNDITVCSNAGTQTLSGYSPAGGSWTGPGVSSSGIFNPTTVGNFTLTYTYSNSGGCSASDQMTVSVVAPGSVNAGNDVTICLNATPQQLLSGGTWTGSTWVSPSGLFTPGAVGSYTLTYTASTGLCTASDNINVLVLSLPTTNAGADQSICIGQTVQLNATATSPNGVINAYTWTSGAVNNSLISNPTASPVINTTYTVVATDAFGCSTSDQVAVNVSSLPTVNAGNDITVCLNSGATSLTGFSPAGGTWSGTGVSAAGVFTPTSIGSSVLTYTYSNANNCSSSDQITVTTIAGGTVNGGADQNICVNSPAVQLASGGTWTGSSSVTSGGLFTPNVIGTHTLTYSALSGGCMASDQVIIQVLPLPVVNAGNDLADCTGNSVQLSATASSSNGSISSYSWSPAVVSNASIANPSLLLNANQTLTIQVTDASGCTATDQITLTANPLPTVNAGSDVSFCNQPIAQQLTGFTPAGGTWTGSNVSSTGVYTPTNLGSVVLNYCVTNAFNCTACDQITVTTTSTALANAGADVDVCVGSPAFTLQAVTSGGTWTPNTYMNASGVFSPTQTGSFTCTYNIGSGSCLSSDTKLVTVHQLPVVSAGPDVTICEGNSYQIFGGATGSGALTFSWNNPTLLDDPAIGFPTINTASDVDMTLTVTDAQGCVSSDVMHLTIDPLPHAAFNMPAIACVSSSVTFTNTSTNADYYEWSFGNSNNSIDVNPSNIYTTPGTYDVQLISYNGTGCPDTIVQSIEIISAPTAAFTTSVNGGCSPLAVQIQNLSTGVNYSCTWDIGGNAYSGMNPPITTLESQLATSNQTITLTATNSCGSDTESSVVTVNPQPHAAFSTNLSSQCSPVTTVFANSSAGNPQSYHWDLGDGDSSNQPIPAPKVYTTEDSSEDFIITLTATNECGTDSYSSSLTVLPNTVEMNLQPSVPAGCTPLFVEFNNTTTGATNYSYDFDDNSTSSLMSPNHIFSNPGIYDVLLYANDGCSFDTAMVTITVAQSPSIQISSEESEACPFEDIQFHSTTSGNITSVSWDFGDTQTDSNSDPLHQFIVGNSYFVSATAQDNNGCSATASLPIEIHPQPEAIINLSEIQGCSPLNICTENEALGATSFQWNFGNGNISNSMNDCQEYLNITGVEQDLTIQLDVANDFGCTNHAEQNITVLPQPTTSFSLSDLESCVLMEAVNVLVTTEGSTSYQWFADGNMVSEDFEPTFHFDEVGDHEIHLVSYNDLGCSDVASHTYVIHPLPGIDIMPDVFNGCSPLTVEFENTTSNGDIWEWTFSNGSHSNVQNPTVTFAEPGVYDVQLMATSEFGCQQVQYFDDMIESFVVPTSAFTYSPEGDVIYELDIDFTNGSAGAIDYIWNFGDGFNSNDVDPSHHFRTGGTYYVTLTAINEYGCTADATKEVNIDKTFYFFMPNSFTPGNDGLNDIFLPSFSSTDEIRSYEFTVINRWGEVVFKTNDTTEGWYGNVKNGEYYTHNDLFTWNVKVDFNNLQISKTYTGTVTILR